MRAVQITEHGGPEVLRVADVDTPAPGPGQILVRVAAAGVNFIDTYHRSGRYPLALPSGLGLEGAGTVEAAGTDVEGFIPGDRVVWMATLGSYASHVVVDAQQAVAVPDGVDLQLAAALLLQGVTAHYLASSTFALQPGHTALVHAAAGGVGGLLTQVAKLRGARVLATVSTDEKERLAREAGADEVIRYTQTDVATAVRDLTGGVGVEVVYDSVGKDTFDASLDCLKVRGVLVLYGQSSGPVPPLDPQVLNAKGGLYLTRPSTGHYTQTRAELLQRAGELLDWLDAGSLVVRVDRTWPLAEVADAHRYLEGRQSKGKLLLLP